MTDQATNPLEDIERLGWIIVAADPAALEVTGRDRVGAPATYAQRDGFYTAERSLPTGLVRRETWPTPEDLLRAVCEFDERLARKAAASVPAVSTRSDSSSPQPPPPLEERVREGVVDSTGLTHRPNDKRR
jgi:hypothetical protein